MRQGTTPTHTFVLTFDTSTLLEFEITYAQEDAVILTKELDDCTLDEYSVSLTLTQEETFLFNAAHPAQVQVRAKLTNGTALASDIMRAPVDRSLSREVL